MSLEDELDRVHGVDVEIVRGVTHVHQGLVKVLRNSVKERPGKQCTQHIR